jgi:hypothetical protein
MNKSTLGDPMFHFGCFRTTCGGHFGIDFPAFSKTCKSTSGAHSFTLSMILVHEKPFILGSKFQRFFMFFQNRSRRPFLEGPGADLASTGRFWCHFRFPGFPKRHQLDTLFLSKIDFRLPGGMPETIIRPTLARFATRRNISFDFGIFFDEFQGMLDQFGMVV